MRRYIFPYKGLPQYQELTKNVSIDPAAQIKDHFMSFYGRLAIRTSYLLRAADNYRTMVLGDGNQYDDFARQADEGLRGIAANLTALRAAAVDPATTPAQYQAAHNQVSAIIDNLAKFMDWMPRGKLGFCVLSRITGGNK